MHMHTNRSSTGRAAGLASLTFGTGLGLPGMRSFLTDRFEAFGTEFQNWMVIVAAAVTVYLVYLLLRR
jgi:hypothetical protein